MFELLVRAYIEDRHREVDECIRATEAARYAKLSAPVHNSRWSRPFGRGQRASRPSSAALTAGHSASTTE